jgi:hypothetical protein
LTRGPAGRPTDAIRDEDHSARDIAPPAVQDGWTKCGPSNGQESRCRSMNTALGRVHRRRESRPRRLHSGLQDVIAVRTRPGSPTRVAASNGIDPYPRAVAGWTGCGPSAGVSPQSCRIGRRPRTDRLKERPGRPSKRRQEDLRCQCAHRITVVSALKTPSRVRDGSSRRHYAPTSHRASR